MDGCTYACTYAPVSRSLPRFSSSKTVSLPSSQVIQFQAPTKTEFHLLARAIFEPVARSGTHSGFNDSGATALKYTTCKCTETRCFGISGGGVIICSLVMSNPRALHDSPPSRTLSTVPRLLYSCTYSSPRRRQVTAHSSPLEGHPASAVALRPTLIRPVRQGYLDRSPIAYTQQTTQTYTHKKWCTGEQTPHSRANI
jgi:hypothetical protein